MQRYFIEIAYAGKNYHGWQRQPDAVSIQQVLEERMSLLLRENIRLTAAGRTDAGVHALQSFAHFDVENEPDIPVFLQRINDFLPKDIVIKNMFPVKPGAHARYDAVSRSYVYKISLNKNPFLQDFAWEFRRPLDMEKMNTAAAILLEYTDFEAFSKVKTDVKTFICHIKEAYWKREGDLLLFRITADRFLRNMVRAIVGTLTDVGLGKIPPGALHGIIESKNRGKAGSSAPAHGLFLEKVVYPDDIFIK